MLLAKISFLQWLLWISLRLLMYIKILSCHPWLQYSKMSHDLLVLSKYDNYLNHVDMTSKYFLLIHAQFVNNEKSLPTYLSNLFTPLAEKIDLSDPINFYLH